MELRNSLQRIIVSKKRNFSPLKTETKAFSSALVGHFYLTQLLLPLLTNARVVNVSSLAHYSVKSKDLDYTFKQWKNQYPRIRAYGLSKLAQIYHARELHRRYGIKAYSLHPGTIINTNFHHEKPLFKRILLQLLSIIGKSVEQGSMTSLYCALSDDAKPGHFHSNCRTTSPSTLALDHHQAEQCWIESEKFLNGKIQ